MRSLVLSRLRPNARPLLSPFVSFTQSTRPPLLPLIPTRSLHGQPFVAGSSQPVGPDPSRILRLATPQAEDEEDSALNEFLSSFVWAIRPQINDAYLDLPKEIVDSMLLVIFQKVVALMDSAAAVEESPVELSEDLWKTVVEVSSSVQQAMQRDRMREDLKKYIHAEEVKEMCRFAADIGIRGPMLRELRFKWAREKLEDVKFYQSLDKMRKQAQEREEREKRVLLTSGSDEQHTSLAKENGAESKVVSLPQRKGKIKFKIYGLDLSHPKWAEVAEKAAEFDEGYVPGEPREPLQSVDGKCKKVEDSILSLNAKQDDPAPLLEEWKELLRPRRADWLALLDRIKEKNAPLYMKAYRQANDPDNARSYFDHMMNSGYKPDDQCTASMIAAYAKQNLLDKALDLLLTLEKDGFQPGIATYSVLVDWFGKLQLVEEAEATLQKITEKGDAPFEVHVSLCDMYSRAQIESKARKHLKVLEARKELLRADQYDQIISALIAGRLLDDAKRMHERMLTQGFKLAEATATALSAAQSMPRYKTPTTRGGKP